MQTFLIGVLCCLFIGNHFAQAQVGINTASPDASSVLDITSVGTPRGLLIPRIDSAARVGMTGMANSLLVYDTSKKLFFIINKMIIVGMP